MSLISNKTHTYAYLGPQGTYSHEAALIFMEKCTAGAFSGDPAVSSPAVSSPAAALIECASISEIFEMVDRGQASFGVVPIENALEGSVNETLDAFAFSSDAHIRAEIVVDIHHNLIAKPGTKLTSVKTVVSHPQALGQTRRWRLKNLPASKTIPAASTADAVRTAMLDETSNTTAAIGNVLAARLFDGEIIDKQIEDRFGNQTRFVLIGTNQLPSSNNTRGYKTSLALFMREDRPGTLLMILEEFAYAGLNMTKIQSRPTKKALGDYMFWIDLEGHVDDSNVKTALDCLRLKLREVKVIGSYPIAADAVKSTE